MPLDTCMYLENNFLISQPKHMLSSGAVVVSLTIDPGVTSSIPAWSHTYVDFDQEISFTVIFVPSAESRRVVVS